MRAIFGVTNVSDWLDTNAVLLFDCLLTIDEELNRSVAVFVEVVTNHDNVVPATLKLLQGKILESPVQIVRDCLTSLFTDDLNFFAAFADLDHCSSSMNVLKQHMLSSGIENCHRKNCPETDRPLFHDDILALNTSRNLNQISKVEESSPISVETSSWWQAMRFSKLDQEVLCTC